MMKFDTKHVCIVVGFLASAISGWSGIAQCDDSADRVETRTIVSGSIERSPEEARRAALRNRDSRDTHQVDEVSRRYGISGRGIKVGIWDFRGVRTSHNEFRENRAIQRDSPWTTSEHATHVSGTIGACGTTCDFGDELATGMAPAITMLTYDWNNDLVELEQAAGEEGIACSNHSYGRYAGWVCKRKDNATRACVDWHWYGMPESSEKQAIRFGRYNDDSRAIDAVAYRNPEVAIFKSAGNSRNGGPRKTEQPVKHTVHPDVWTTFQSLTVRETNGVRGGYDTVEGKAVAKNVITIGAIDDITRDPPLPADVIPTSFSSFGPADDGRIKPDLVANGFRLYSPTNDSDASYVKLSGTSMATPTSCGICALMNELSLRKRGRKLYADELKAVLIHTAMSPNDGPSYQIGWGSIRADVAGKVITDVAGVNYRMLRGSLTPEQRVVTYTGLAEADSPVRATLVWIDPPATALGHTEPIDDPRPALVNDLDLVLLAPDGQTHYPWRLDFHRRDLSQPPERATRGTNSVDNVERVDALGGSMQAGVWTVQVSMDKAPVDDEGKVAPQRFALVIEGLDESAVQPAEARTVGPEVGDGNEPPPESDSDSSTAPRETETAPRKRHALLIGVQDYARIRNFNRLQGPRNDIDVIQRVLTENLGFAKENIITLIDGGTTDTLAAVDGPATHCRIRKAFLDLAQELGSGDQLYVHFSGHGSQIPNPAEDPAMCTHGEQEGKDQTWVTWRARHADTPADFCPKDMTNLNAFDIIDDELNSWLAKLDDKGVEVVLVSDSCHSATVTRTRTIGLRTAPPDTRTHPANDPGYCPSKLRHAVRIGAAYDRDTAQEEEFGGEIYGNFSWYWAQALATATPETSWEDAFEQAAAQVRKVTFELQHPTIWGERKRTAIISGEFLAHRVTLTVEKVRGTGVHGDIVELSGGRLVGATPRSVYRRLPAVGEGADIDQPRIVIRQATPFESSAEIRVPEGTGTGRVVRSGDRFVEERKFYEFSPIKLWVDADQAAAKSNPELVAQLREALRNLDGFALAESRSGRDLEVYVVRYAKAPDGSFRRDPTDSRTFPIPDPNGVTEIWILDRNQDLLHEQLKIPVRSKTSAPLEIVKQNLITFARKRQILDLATIPANLSTEVVLKMRIRSQRPGGEETPDKCDFTGREDQYQLGQVHVRANDKTIRVVGEDRLAVPAPNPLPLRRNDCLSFEVRNNSRSKEVYVYLFNVTPDAKINYVFPFPGDPEPYSLLEAGDRRDYAHPDWHSVWFRADQPSIDILVLLVTAKPIDVGLLKLAGYRTRSKSPASHYNPLESFLVESMYTRSSGRKIPDRWSATEIRLSVPD